jgi:hypothetical protein
MTWQPPKTPRRKRVPKQVSEIEPPFPILEVFHHFLRLPLELREMIWSLAMPCRLITWNYDRPPAMIHACHESRRLWLKKHKIEHWRTSIFDHETLFIDYSSDILYFDRVIPGSKQWTEIPQRIEAPTGPPLYWPRWIGRDEVGGAKWLEELQKLAISAEYAMREFAFTPQSPNWRPRENLDPWKKLNALFPNLRELIVVFGGSLNRGSALEDWVEIGRRHVPVETWCWQWDIPNFRVKSFVGRRLGCLKQVELKFVEDRTRPKHTEVHIT